MSQNSIETNRSDSSESTSSVDRKNKVHSIFSKTFQTNGALDQSKNGQNLMLKTMNQPFYVDQSQLKRKTSKAQSDSSESGPKQLTNSQDTNDKNKMENLKNHKSSFGDYETYANDSEKQFGLKKRISFAFEKSQNALKVYEKYQRKKSGSSLGKNKKQNSNNSSFSNSSRRVSFQDNNNQKVISVISKVK